MKCLDCNHKITTKLSKSRGRGPVCYERFLKRQAKVNKPIINFEIVKNLISVIADKISSKTLELLTILKVAINPNKILNKISETNEIIDRIIRPLFRIVDPIHNKNIIVVSKY